MKLGHTFTIPSQGLEEPEDTYKLRVAAAFEAHLEKIQHQETRLAGQFLGKLADDSTCLRLADHPTQTWEQWKTEQRAIFWKTFNA